MHCLIFVVFNIFSIFFNIFFQNSFGSLFSGGERLGDPMGPIVNLKYSGAEEVTPALTKERKAIRSPNNDVFDGDTL